MRASIYCRISKDREGAGLGVRSQEQDCRALAKNLGATVVSTHTDNDISAYSGKPRPGYRALLSEIEAGSVDAVLCWHTDRLHRSPAELEQYIAACEERGISTHTFKAGTLDLSTPAGRLNARTLGNFARFEVEHMIERQKRAKLRSAESGTWKGGRRPLGYEPDGVTIRESEAAPIRDAYDAILAGMSVRSVARTWNASGLTTTTGLAFDGNDPRRILLRPRNAGLMEHRGEVIGPAEWPGIVSVEKYEAVRRILTDPARRANLTNSRVRHLGSGLFRCGVCGGPMRVTMSDGYRTYRCECNKVSRRQEPVDAYIEAIVVGRLRMPDLADLLASTRADDAVDVKALEAEVDMRRERLDQAAELFSSGSINAAQLGRISRDLNAEIDELREQISAAYSTTAFEGVLDAPDPGAAWLDASLERRRAVVNALMTVTLNPSGRGRPKGWEPGQPYFRPETVSIEWRIG